MKRRTIRIDSEAFERLNAAKRDSGPFSQLIKRLIPKSIPFRQHFNFGEWVSQMEADPFGEEFIDAVEKQIASR